MADVIRAACIQMTSGQNVQKNLDAASELIRAAAADGATFITTPEVTDQIVQNLPEKINTAYTQDDHPGIPFFSALAKELQITLLIGSMAIKISDEKMVNRSFLFMPDGSLNATYDKIHLYDADLGEGEKYRESNAYTSGNQLVVADCNDFKLGMTICYDLRFPHLHRDLAKAGADILTIPVAFTVPSGVAHWEVLTRARAIETGCFVLAPAQTGTHEGGRKTYGHSLIIAPWGEILAQLDDKLGYICSDLDVSKVQEARTKIPALQHDKDYKKIS